ncbi:hypothetical protein TWF106_000310 [Orbilia oligospora]|uniref:Uncharacterized protein n=1 Tax=Orbilia oligospora TaxID=2813651 RepID=A0A7C8QWR2_ORBOL|nr:hypothetical protein TWF106_000310 [Orbilia oligospora]
MQSFKEYSLSHGQSSSMSATFRLRAEEGYWLKLTDTDNQIITKQLEELRGYLIHKAEQGMEVYRFFESQLEEYGIAILATVLLYQLGGLQEIELACSINANSSRFMLTTMHHFDPPFRLQRLGTTRLADFAIANYFLLERFLHIGASKVGIDSRFESTKNAPKIRPEPKFSSDMGTDETVDGSVDGYSDSLSDGSMESEYEISILSQVRIEDTLARTVRQVIQQDYTGYQPLDHQVSGFETGINYNPPGVNPSIENESPLLMRELYLWLDEIPIGQCEPLVSLLSRMTGIRHLEINIFPSVQFVGLNELANVTSFDSFVKIFYAQMETLEALTVRIAWVNAPQLHIPSLRKFDNLRRVHLFYSWDTHSTFTECMKDGGSYFEFMFPQQLDHLRMDMFKARPGLEFASFATQVPSALFPNLRIVLGFAKEKSQRILHKP